MYVQKISKYYNGDPRLIDWYECNERVDFLAHLSGRRTGEFIG